MPNPESPSPNPGVYRGRFAPSPTGPLHFGSLVAAVGSWLRARSQRGAWLVRMEDLDPQREVPGAARDILATLAAFGMVPDEPVVWQRRREQAHDAAFARLRERVFVCRCSRSDLDAHGGLHRGACVARLDPARAPAWRVRVDDRDIGFDDLLQGPYSQNLLRDVGDFVVRRVEGGYAYQFAVVVDDADAGITEVVRGSDLLDSTPRQIFLQQLLGLPTPRYLHLPLVLDRAGAKLSKSTRALPVDRNDPLPTLRTALDFLGLREAARTPASTPETLLAVAAASFELGAMRRKSDAFAALE
ncbi:MAG: tRNA glutamyl-Q(34) synthetase GluQRS [Rudaea sp.]|uniref:tRNA glutamyl-Q(34) synthetase GluQRS n=1 Tax=Rudaea sp. TaxID=2136325 RepID=UPI0039E49385